MVLIPGSWYSYACISPALDCRLEYVPVHPHEWTMSKWWMLLLRWVRGDWDFCFANILSSILPACSMEEVPGEGWVTSGQNQQVTGASVQSPGGPELSWKWILPQFSLEVTAAPLSPLGLLSCEETLGWCLHGSLWPVLKQRAWLNSPWIPDSQKWWDTKWVLFWTTVFYYFYMQQKTNTAYEMVDVKISICIGQIRRSCSAVSSHPASSVAYNHRTFSLYVHTLKTDGNCASEGYYCCIRRFPSRI